MSTSKSQATGAAVATTASKGFAVLITRQLQAGVYVKVEATDEAQAIKLAGQVDADSLIQGLMVDINRSGETPLVFNDFNNDTAEVFGDGHCGGLDLPGVMTEDELKTNRLKAMTHAEVKAQGALL